MTDLSFRLRHGLNAFTSFSKRSIFVHKARSIRSLFVVTGISSPLLDFLGEPLRLLSRAQIVKAMFRLWRALHHLLVESFAGMHAEHWRRLWI